MDEGVEACLDAAHCGTVTQGTRWVAASTGAHAILAVCSCCGRCPAEHQAAVATHCCCPHPACAPDRLVPQMNVWSASPSMSLDEMGTESCSSQQPDHACPSASSVCIHSALAPTRCICAAHRLCSHRGRQAAAAPGRVGRHAEADVVAQVGAPQRGGRGLAAERATHSGAGHAQRRVKRQAAGRVHHRRARRLLLLLLGAAGRVRGAGAGAGRRACT